MALKNSFKIFILIIFSINCPGKTYPELIAKQSNENIRFISRDGKSTYYQKNSGSLIFSKNYKIIDVIKGINGTQYSLFATEAKRKIVISQNENFHTFFSSRLMEKIFIVNFGEAVAREVGSGTSPHLHFNDDWLSYYDSYKKLINFEHTTNFALKFSLKLNNQINPYFIPSIVMTDENNIFYTDLGENGNYGIILYRRNIDKTEVIYKANNPTTKIEIKKCGDTFLTLEAGIAHSQQGSSIYINPLKSIDIKTREKIYNSELDDIGKLTCDFNNPLLVYFIKNVGTKIAPSYDIFELNLSTKKINQLSELKNATTLINMDGIILTFDRGRYLIIKGENDFKNVDSLIHNDIKASTPPMIENEKKENNEDDLK